MRSDASPKRNFSLNVKRPGREEDRRHGVENLSVKSFDFLDVKVGCGYSWPFDCRRTRRGIFDFEYESLNPWALCYVVESIRRLVESAKTFEQGSKALKRMTL
jgi:hypothetical protein